jgi:hypothetical protein
MLFPDLLRFSDYVNLFDAGQLVDVWELDDTYHSTLDSPLFRSELLRQEILWMSNDICGKKLRQVIWALFINLSYPSIQITSFTIHCNIPSRFRTL